MANEEPCCVILNTASRVSPQTLFAALPCDSLSDNLVNSLTDGSEAPNSNAALTGTLPVYKKRIESHFFHAQQTFFQQCYQAWILILLAPWERPRSLWIHCCLIPTDATLTGPAPLEAALCGQNQMEEGANSANIVAHGSPYIEHPPIYYPVQPEFGRDMEWDDNAFSDIDMHSSSIQETLIFQHGDNSFNPETHRWAVFNLWMTVAYVAGDAMFISVI
ncbi:hypothetical protein Ocin01_19258 [Orchesella cincta]|uniref:Uncharacterized protein n=1 Tax=Orchesella cincta TaxID=48709 RepID=A0A1D2M376_ORCCI|nr:hypothetical protein Ocin01_19258 [Orchesella cincta]